MIGCLGCVWELFSLGTLLEFNGLAVLWFCDLLCLVLAWLVLPTIVSFPGGPVLIFHTTERSLSWWKSAACPYTYNASFWSEINGRFLCQSRGYQRTWIVYILVSMLQNATAEFQTQQWMSSTWMHTKQVNLHTLHIDVDPATFDVRSKGAMGGRGGWLWI